MTDAVNGVNTGTQSQNSSGGQIVHDETVDPSLAEDYNYIKENMNSMRQSPPNDYSLNSPIQMTPQDLIRRNQELNKNSQSLATRDSQPLTQPANQTQGPLQRGPLPQGPFPQGTLPQGTLPKDTSPQGAPSNQDPNKETQSLPIRA